MLKAGFAAALTAALLVWASRAAMESLSSTSVSAGALPLYGTCVICSPSADASAAVARWVIVPVPDEP